MSVEPEPVAPRRRLAPTAVRLVTVLAVATALVLVVRDQGAGLRHDLGRVSVGSLAAALALGLVAVWFSLLSWRAALAAVGARLPLRACAGVFLPSQLGKYVPGSVWPVVAQAQLGRRHGVTRTQMATGSLLALGLSIVVSSAVGVFALPALAGHGSTGAVVTVAVVLSIVAGAVTLHPRVLGPVLDLALRLMRRPALGRPDGVQVLRSVLAALASWLCFGAHAAVLAHAVGGRGLTPFVAMMALPLASAAGILVVIAPAGAGIRETVMVLLLKGRLGVDAATALVLLSRGLLAATDLVAAAVGALLRGPPGWLAGRVGRPAPSPAADSARSTDNRAVADDPI